MARVLSEVGFVHLHVHSSYSLLEGALKVADLAKLAAADRQPALALTDTNNLFGALEFSEKLAWVRHPADRRHAALRPVRGAGPRRPAGGARGDGRGPPGADARRATAT